MTLSRTLGIGAIVLVAALNGCDEGLSPLNEPAGFSGRITYSNWPAGADVNEMRLVAFTEYPSDSAGIFQMLLSHQAIIYPNVGQKGLPLQQPYVDYSFMTDGTLLQVGEYKYVVVAEQYDKLDYTKWRPAGVYTLKPNTFEYSPVIVLLHKVTPNININVDFTNLPPKPWN